MPDFLALQLGLQPVPWQPAPSKHRLLALYKNIGNTFQSRLDQLLQHWRKVFQQT